MANDPKSPLVGIVMGSKSDWPVLQKASEMLTRFEIPHECRVLSAHRTPDQALEWAATASQRGMKVLIAAAGGAAHLGGVIAAKTLLPVLGVPMETKLSGGLDSLLSMVQMPRGVPVGTLAVGEAGAVNAALLAAQILALHDAGLREKLAAFRKARADEVLNEKLG